MLIAITRGRHSRETSDLGCMCGECSCLLLRSVVNMNRGVLQTLHLFSPVWEQVGLALLERRMYCSNVTHTVGRCCVEGRGPDDDDDARP